MSLLVFTGASQFSAVSVIGAGGSAASALGGALLLAARNGVYGLTMAPRISRARCATRLVAAQLTIDESTAMATAQDDRDAQRAAFWITGVSHLHVLEPRHAARRARSAARSTRRRSASTPRSPPAFVAMLWPLLRDAPRARRRRDRRGRSAWR